MTDEGIPVKAGVYGDAAEGRRLILAFTRVSDPALREAIIVLVERIASTFANGGAIATPPAPPLSD